MNAPTKPFSHAVQVKHLDVMLRPDPDRTVIRPFLPGDPARFEDKHRPRPQRIVERVLALHGTALTRQIERMEESLDKRHRDVDRGLMRRYDEVKEYVPANAAPTDEHKLLIGAYLSAEYSFEAAALFNPSAVPHPDQSDVEDGALRILVSLRGIGEGHLSSVTFRTGTWRADDSLTIDDPSGTAVPPIVADPQGWHDGDTIQLDCSGARDVSEVVLFPLVPNQSRGIEDLRLTTFDPPDEPRFYIGSYTALGDKGVRQELLRTDDFHTFKMHPVKGDLADGKGMALFPEMIGGKFAAIGRQDNENLWLVTTEDRFTWSGGEKLLAPKYPWEIIQIGNCGSPIAIDEGWLLLTHGVGVVRNYCMGAALLDRDDPSKVLGRLAQPLLEPGPEDRDGYVPNVVYSCGGIVRGRTLLLPYGVADNYASFATVSVDELIAAMVPPEDDARA